MVCLLKQRVRAGRATFLIKVQSHRGELTIEVQQGNTTVRQRPVWTNRVCNAFRKQAGWAKLQEVRATAAKHWTERMWYCHNQPMRSSKEGAETSRSGSIKNGQEWGKKCFDDLDQRRMGRPATCTWSTDFLLREGSSREEGYRRTAACMLCQKAHEESGSSWNGELPEEKSAAFRAHGALDKRRWSLPRTMRASGSCYRWMMPFICSYRNKNARSQCAWAGG